MLRRELLLADLEDLVGAEAVEGAQADERVERLGAKGRLLDGVREPLLEPARVVLERRLRTCGGRGESAPVGPVVGPDTSCGHLDLVDEDRQVARGRELHLVPETDRAVAEAVA